MLQLLGYLMVNLGMENGPKTARPHLNRDPNGIQPL